MTAAMMWSLKPKSKPWPVRLIPSAGEGVLLVFSAEFLRKIYNCTIPPPFLPYPSLPSLPSPPLPLLAGVRGYHPRKKLELEMLVGEF